MLNFLIRWLSNQFEQIYYDNFLIVLLRIKGEKMCLITGTNEHLQLWIVLIKNEQTIKCLQ